MLTYAEMETLLGRRSEVDVPCPLCSPRRKRGHQKLRVLHLWHKPEKGGLITYNCVHCGEHGGIMPDGEARQLSWRELQAMDEERARRERADTAKRIGDARRLYDAGVPARGTLVERYFAGRGLDVPEVLWRQLRFDPDHPFGTDGRHPAVLMPFRELLRLEITGVHRIALTPLGEGRRRADGKKLKKSSGVIAGSAMMWRRIGEQATVCEGLETALGILMGGVGRGAVLAVSGTRFLEGFKAPFQVDELLIAADHDKDGRRAAEGCQKGNSCDSEILLPEQPGTDFADQFRRGGKDEQKASSQRGQSEDRVQD